MKAKKKLLHSRLSLPFAAHPRFSRSQTFHERGALGISLKVFAHRFDSLRHSVASANHQTSSKTVIRVSQPGSRTCTYPKPCSYLQVIFHPRPQRLYGRFNRRSSSAASVLPDPAPDSTSNLCVSPIRATQHRRHCGLLSLQSPQRTYCYTIPISHQPASLEHPHRSTIDQRKPSKPSKPDLAGVAIQGRNSNVLTSLINKLGDIST